MSLGKTERRGNLKGNLTHELTQDQSHNSVNRNEWSSHCATQEGSEQQARASTDVITANFSFQVLFFNWTAFTYTSFTYTYTCLLSNIYM